MFNPKPQSKLKIAKSFFISAIKANNWCICGLIDLEYPFAVNTVPFRRFRNYCNVAVLEIVYVALHTFERLPAAIEYWERAHSLVVGVVLIIIIIVIVINNNN